MGLFSFLNKNKQDSADDDGDYVSRDDDALAAKARSKRASSAGEPAARRGREGKAVADPVLPEKKRARRRLVGAVALALAVAIGLPMILDSEPKPLATDIDIRIPSKDKAPPQVMPAATAPVAAADALDTSEEIVEPASMAEPPVRQIPVPLDVAEVRTAPLKPAVKAEPKQDLKPDPKPEPKIADKPVKPAEPKPAVAKGDDAARALAILEGKPAAPSQKYVVQVAALQSPEKVAELQDKLKAAGIPSFTQKSGEWIRIRVGPFSKEEGEQIRAKLDKLGLSGKVQPN